MGRASLAGAALGWALLVLALAALVRGPERLSAAVGLTLSLLFLLYFTGFGFAIVGLFG